MSNHAHDYDQIVALLKSIAAPCEQSWETCRHCLAVEQLEHTDIKAKLAAFLTAVEIADKEYGKVR